MVPTFPPTDGSSDLEKLADRNRQPVRENDDPLFASVHLAERQAKAARDQAPIQSAELAELRKLAEAATPGPWAVNTAGSMKNGKLTTDEVYVYSPAKRNVAIAADVADPDTGEMSEPNAQFIAAANPATILRLLESLDHAHAALYAGVADRAAVPAAQEQAQSDLMPKRTAFIKYCERRGLDASVEKDAWGAHIFKHTHIQAMWEGWFNAPTEATAGQQSRSPYVLGLKPSNWDEQIAAAPPPAATPAQEQKPAHPYGYWQDGEWYGFCPEEHAELAEGETFELTPVWTHGKPVTFLCVAVPDSDDFDYVPATPADAALLERYAERAAPQGERETEQKQGE